MNSVLRVRIGRALLAVGLVLFVWAAGTWIDAQRVQDAMRRRLEAFAAPPQTGTIDVARVTRRVAREHGLIGRITIPSLGVSAMVLEGTSGKVLRRGVGHVEHTAFPGEPGNVGLAGHRDTFFRALRDVLTGDRIEIQTPDGMFRYAVDTVMIVPPDRIDLLADEGRGALTLVTCYPFHWVGPAPERFVVRARPEAPALTAHTRF